VKISEIQERNRPPPSWSISLSPLTVGCTRSHSQNISSIIKMQRSCSTCLARRTFDLGIGGSRSYSIVPKSPLKSNPSGRHDGPSKSSRVDYANQRDDVQLNDRRESGKRASSTGGSRTGSGHARRARLAGFLDDPQLTNVKRDEMQSRSSASGTTDSDSIKDSHAIRNDRRRPDFDSEMIPRPTRQGPRSSTKSDYKPLQTGYITRKPPPTPTSAESVLEHNVPGPSRRKVSLP